MKVTLITDSAKLDTAVDAAVKSASSLSKRLHAVLCSLNHNVIEHGDVRMFVRLIDGLTENAKGVKVNAIISWVTKFAPITRTETESGTVNYTLDKVRRDQFAADRTQFVQAGMDKPFWLKSSVEGAGYVAMDVYTVLTKLIARLESDSTKASVDNGALVIVLTKEAAKLAPKA